MWAAWATITARAASPRRESTSGNRGFPGGGASAGSTLPMAREDTAQACGGSPPLALAEDQEDVAGQARTADAAEPRAVERGDEPARRRARRQVDVGLAELAGEPPVGDQAALRAGLLEPADVGAAREQQAA